MTGDFFIKLPPHHVTALEGVIERFADSTQNRNPMEQILVKTILPAAISLKACVQAEVEEVIPEFDPDLPGRGDEFIQLNPFERNHINEAPLINDDIYVDGKQLERFGITEDGDSLEQLIQEYVPDPNAFSDDHFQMSKEHPAIINLRENIEKKFVNDTYVPPTPPHETGLPEAPFLLDPATGEMLLDEFGNPLLDLEYLERLKELEGVDPE